jgi:SanA protein
VFVNLLVITICNWKVESASQHLVSRDLSQIPPSKVGLLLGTSKYLRSGEANPYFYNRIDAAAELYQAGKIEYILVSGDNGSIYYNEPRDMKKALLERGIPEKSIYMDYAGFRTLDSVIRCKEIFGQHRFIVISQEFHTKRAVYIARTHGLETFGYNAKDVQYQGLELSLREKLARVKAFIDVNILMEKPRFLGERIPIK